MRKVIKFSTPPRFLSYSAVGGYEEGRGPMGDRLDMCDPTDRFGQKTWEMSEGEMGRCALNLAMSKIGMSHTELEMLVAGDLQNQCVASAVGLGSFGIPYLGIYGACSTCTEGLLLLSSLLSVGGGRVGASVTSSHNCASERQFRSPIEYGGQRTPSAQWTATAAGAFIMSTDPALLDKSFNGCSNISIPDVMIGKIVDGATTDATNMGAAMSFSALDTVISYFEHSGYSPSDFDYIVTGDLGAVGSDILEEALDNALPGTASRHRDCGLMLYDMKRRDVHSGASGCGTSASVLACHFLPLLAEGKIKNVLFLSTGALMSKSSVLQGNTIKGITPAIHLCYSPINQNKSERI